MSSSCMDKKKKKTTLYILAQAVAGKGPEAHIQKIATEDC